METIILISVVAISIFATIAAIISRYKRCPSDKLLVVYGRTGKKTDGSGDTSTASVFHGGGAFIWPVIQDFAFLDLKPMSIEVDLKNALSKQNIRINVPSVFTVAIDSNSDVRIAAAERLLGLDRNSIAALAQDIIFGQMRQVIAQMTIEEINADRDTFLENISTNLEMELHKIGLKLINVNVTDIHDNDGYLEALGKEAAAKALNEAKVSVSEKNMIGAIGEAKNTREKEISVAQERTQAEIGKADADRERRIKMADAESLSAIGEADAESKASIGSADAESTKRIRTSELNALAIAGENEAAKRVAETTAERRVVEAEANRVSVTAQKVKAAEALKDSYEAERDAETKRAEKDKATEYANIVIPAQVNKERIEINAQAEANKQRELAKGEADAIFAKMEAEAKGDYARLSEQARGIKELVDAAGGDPDKAVQLMIADKLERLVEIQVDAIKNIKIDKITVWDQGSGSGANGGQSSTSGFLRGLLTAVPGFEEVYAMAGKELPSILQGSGTKVANELEAMKESKRKSLEESAPNDGTDVTK